MRSLTLGRPLDAYTGVVIRAGQDADGNDVTIAVGDSTGYVLEIDNPIGTQAMAYAILAGLRLRGARYRPFEAAAAMLDPAAEIGDGVSVNGTDSVILSMHTKHTRLMAADISAPYDEEVDHEFTFVPRTQREFKRESAYVRSRITQTADRITFEVARATEAEGLLSSRITQTADRITAEVARATEAEGSLSSQITQTADLISAKVSKTGGSPSSFGWELTDSEWRMVSNNTVVFRATAGGIEINGSGNFTGTITATAGVIGGVRIENGTLSGITDTNIAQGGISGGTSGSIKAATITTHNTVSGINTNLGYGAAYGLATTNGSGVYPSFFRSGIIYVSNSFQVAGSFQFGTTFLTLKTVTISGTTINYLGY